ncbi:hypothetical protein PNEG_02768 [Pneumocystis murina B123]|uniref:DNA replication complex GINS protein PSF2 n=1 Tax=Pneumocystis murina (strain B123) TaxID=1069680 RepID=M7NP06_PNEMU|nr:hypothetical protein PNEG_02768 [Pneumocystis murina B123]EMR08992.1 hypothetical protein PNEG_02768 [Pneumocystis murina B123]
MALRPCQIFAFTPSEIAFIAESSPIEIIPRQTMDALPLIGGIIPQFKPPSRVTVPLWMAIFLKRQKRANILPPSWLSQEALEGFLEAEHKVENGFSALPLRWFEISSILLEVASDDLDQPELIRRLLRDLRETRQGKTRDGLASLNETHLQMDNLGSMEINEIRSFFAKSMDQIRRLSALSADNEDLNEMEDQSE